MGFSGSALLTDKTDDDAYVFWYATPSKDSHAAYGTLVSGWIAAGVVPRQGTPLEVARRTADAAVQVKQHPPPRTAEDVSKILGEYADGAVLQLRAQADLYLAGAVVRARIEFEYLGEDELAPPRVDPRRDFMQGVLFLPQYWREKAKGYEGGDPGGAAALIEDSLSGKYVRALAEKTSPLAMYSGPEHDNIRWRFTERELRQPLAPRLSEISRCATYLSPAQVEALGAAHVERLVHVFAWLHAQEPRLKPFCLRTENGGAILSRWPGALDRDPKFASLLSVEDREAFDRVRRALLPGAR